MFIAMAYYEGETLKKKVSSEQLSVDSVIDIAVQIAQGLAKAYEKGIVHRDIKPANIIVQPDGTVKIIDFGLSKLLSGQDITKPGPAKGTVAYMSPEQAKGKTVDHRTDIWALGVVLYEMLIREHPFKGEIDQAVIYSILNEAPEPMTDLYPDIPVALQQIVDRALAKRTEERYQNIDEMLSALRSVSEGFKPGQIRSRAAKATHRKRKRIFLYGSIATLLILLVAGWLYLFPERSESIDSVAVLQSQVAQDIVREIEMAVTPEENVQLTSTRPVNKEAYQAYLKGRFHWEKHTEAGLQKSIEYFEEAIATDPSYANPYAGLAEAYMDLGVLGFEAVPVRELMTKAKIAAMKKRSRWPNALRIWIRFPWPTKGIWPCNISTHASMAWRLKSFSIRLIWIKTSFLLMASVWRTSKRACLKKASRCFKKR